MHPRENPGYAYVKITVNLRVTVTEGSRADTNVISAYFRTFIVEAHILHEPWGPNIERRGGKWGSSQSRDS